MPGRVAGTLETLVIGRPGTAAVRSRARVRSDHLVHLFQAGWDDLWRHGVRTLVDLRTHDEVLEHDQRGPHARAHGLEDVREAMRRKLENSDVFGDLRRRGFQDADVEALRARMLTDI